MIVWQLDIQLHMQLVHINTEVVSLNPAHNSIQHYMIKSVSDLWQVSVFLQGTAASSTNKTDHHNITEILLKMALSTIPPPPFILQVIAV